MTGNFSVIHEGSTLIKDHRTAVNALNDIAGAVTAADAKVIAAKALIKMGETVDLEATGEAVVLETPPAHHLVHRGNNDD
jgi:hypothetical protein